MRMDTAKDGVMTKVKDMALAIVLTTSALILEVMQMVLAKMTALEAVTFLMFNNQSNLHEQFTTKHTNNMANMINKICIIRSYESGVHFGEVLETRDTIHGLSVTLKDSRRVHYWEGAASLSQMALDGIKTGRIAMVLPEIQVENVCEIIPMSDAAIDNMKKQPIWRV
jgi:hypothetical protein